jgi:hypothetical protein
MIPFRDVIPSRIAPIVTVALIGVNAAAFLLVPAESLAGSVASFFCTRAGSPDFQSLGALAVR